MRRRLSFLAVGLVIGAAAVPASASAALITVNNANDNPANPATECKGVALDCSLRQAVDKAHAGDTIQVPASIPAIALTGGVITISKSLTISGAGATKNKIDGQLSTELFAIPSGSTVTISGLTLTRGRAEFGAVINTGGSTVTLNGDAFTDNVAGGSNTSGFGVIDDGGPGIAKLTVTGSSFSSNNVGGGGTGGSGFGAIDFVPTGGGSSLTISNTTFSGNIIGGGGGTGFGTVDYDAAVPGDALTVSGSRFVSNAVGGGGATGAFGGGLDVSSTTSGTVAITGNTFSSNTAGGGAGAGTESGSGFGGGVEAEAGSGTTFSLENNTFSGNRAGSPGGGGNDSGSGFGGGLSISVATGASVTIAGNTFTGERAGGAGGAGPNSGDGYGGAIDIESVSGANPVALINNTITGTTGGGAPGAGANSGGGFGGGVYVENGPASFVNDTIDGNSLGAGSVASAGGGIEGQGSNDPSVTLKNTIVANNTVAGAANNCGSVFASQGHNISTTPASECGFTAAGDKVADPHLGALGNNGGPTETQALAGGPAINAGTNTGCPATDQRGVKRPQQGICDIGAYESAPPQSAATAGATAVTPVSAKLRGKATNPDVVGARALFQFGKTNSYGSTTTVQAVPADGTGISISLPAAKLKPGTTYHYRLVVTNQDGQIMSADARFKTTALKLSALKLKPSKLKGKQGTTISYRDNAAGSTTFTVLRAKPGFRSGSKCVAKRPRHGKPKKCTLLGKVGSFKHRGASGANHFHFNGKLGGHRLAPGKYVLDAITTVAGKKSKPVKTTFRVS